MASASRLKHYAEVGAGFAKWRGVIAITANAPTRNGIRANAHVLARYAALCQEAGIVPVVEPEVLADGEPGDHSIERCEEVTGEVLETVFTELRLAGVDLSGMLLKPNMVLAGIRSTRAAERRGGRRAHRRLPQGACPGGRPRHRLPLRRPERRGGDGAPLGDEQARPPALAADLLLWPRAADRGAPHLERQGRKRRRGAEGVRPPRADERARLGRANGAPELDLAA